MAFEDGLGIHALIIQQCAELCSCHVPVGSFYQQVVIGSCDLFSAAVPGLESATPPLVIAVVSPLPAVASPVPAEQSKSRKSSNPCQHGIPDSSHRLDSLPTLPRLYGSGGYHREPRRQLDFASRRLYLHLPNAIEGWQSLLRSAPPGCLYYLLRREPGTKARKNFLLNKLDSTAAGAVGKAGCLFLWG